MCACACVYLGGLLCARGQLISEDDAGGQSFDSYSERMKKKKRGEINRLICCVSLFHINRET